jgi:hypothetical protein
LKIDRGVGRALIKEERKIKVEFGTYDELIKLKGEFYNLKKLQD